MKYGRNVDPGIAFLPGVVIVGAIVFFIVATVAFASIQKKAANFALGSGFTVLVVTDPDNCPACKDMIPELAKVKQTIRGTSIGYKETKPTLALTAKYSLIGIPTVIIRRGGKEITRFVGFTSATQILKYLPSATTQYLGDYDD